MKRLVTFLVVGALVLGMFAPGVGYIFFDVDSAEASGRRHHGVSVD